MGLGHGAGIIRSGLVLYLDAANKKSYPGTGTVWTDLSDSGNNGTLVNGAGYNSANNGSIVFDGSNQYVNLGSKQFNTASGTISFWIKLSTTIDSTTYVGNQRPFGSNGDFELRWGGYNPSSLNYKLGFDIGSSGNTTNAVLETTRTTWSNISWYNIVAVWDSSITTSYFYVNGILESTGTTASTATLTALTGTAYIGRSTSGGYLAGQIPIFSAYNRALSVSDIRQNFNALRGRYGI